MNYLKPNAMKAGSVALVNSMTKDEIRASEMRELRRLARQRGCKIEDGEFVHEHDKHGEIYRLWGRSVSIYAWFDSHGSSRFSVFSP